MAAKEILDGRVADENERGLTLHVAIGELPTMSDTKVVGSVFDVFAARYCCRAVFGVRSLVIVEQEPWPPWSLFCFLNWIAHEAKRPRVRS